MKIVCAKSVLFGREAFSTLGEVRVLPDRNITRADVVDADILAIRSKTEVTRALIDNASLRYVGTATAGYDHIDTEACRKAGIAWGAAPGCNANSVAEYMTAALLHLAVEKGCPLKGRTLAVIGVGQVGHRVVAKARALGLRVLQNDPPRAAVEHNFELRPLAEILPEADFVTLHVPLTDEGPWATRAMVNADFFGALRPGAVFFNASRGEVVNERALQKAMDEHRLSHVVLDVWDHEPVINFDLCNRVDLGTPHIAGYSYDGKLDGTLQIYREACRIMGAEPTWDPTPLLPPPAVPRVELDARARTDEQVLHELVRRVYDIAADDLALRQPAEPDDAKRGARFDHLRATYPQRCEFHHTEARVVGGSSDLLSKIHGLGFGLSD